VLQVCADNFDYDELRQDFIRGVVIDEVYKYKIYTHIISNEYAARVNTLRTYLSVRYRTFPLPSAARRLKELSHTSKDIIYRWTHPLVPESNFLGDTSYTYSRYNIYKEDNVKLARFVPSPI
jgi:translation initiation factor eIF-2B subunit epsilon